jgi:nucleoside-diphosphate-sugar epimerase
MKSAVATAGPELHVVLGAGQIGTKVAELLLARNHRVRMVRQSAALSGLAGVEDISANVSDAGIVRRVAEGAAVVYHCVNPPFHQWGELLLPMTRGIVDGVARAGARLVVLDNLYAYGDTAKMDEQTALAPVSKKGRLRALAAEYVLEAGERGLHVSIGRASDFFGPATPRSILGEHFLQRIVTGKSAQLFGDLGQRHSYSFSPDVAAGLVALGSRSDTAGVWMLPVQPAESTRHVVRRFEVALRREIKIDRIPTLILRGAGVFRPLLRELAEIAYQWEQPFVVNDTKFRTKFDICPTDWTRAIDATIGWAQQAYGMGRASARESGQAA